MRMMLDVYYPQEGVNMSRTIRWARDSQKKRLNYFESRFVDSWFTKRELPDTPPRYAIYLGQEETSEKERSSELRRDGFFSDNGSQFYKAKRNRERRSFERQELNRVFQGKKSDFDDVFEKAKEWMD